MGELITESNLRMLANMARYNNGHCLSFSAAFNGLVETWPLAWSAFHQGIMSNFKTLHSLPCRSADFQAACCNVPISLQKSCSDMLMCLRKGLQESTAFASDLLEHGRY